MKTRELAWLVAYLYPDGTYQLGIFSEPSPTVMGSVTTSRVMSGFGLDYESAREDLLTQIKRSLPTEIARHGEDAVRIAKGLRPKKRVPTRRGGSLVNL